MQDSYSAYCVKYQFPSSDCSLASSVWHLVGTAIGPVDNILEYSQEHE